LESWENNKEKESMHKTALKHHRYILQQSKCRALVPESGHISVEANTR